MKLELKHLAPYLPYELKYKGTYGGVSTLRKLEYCNRYNEETDSYTDEIGVDGYLIQYIKPILRPLSDLTKEIDHNGEILVFSDVYLSNSKIEMLLDQKLCLFNNPLNSLDYNSINLLLKYHFDIFGLIDAGLAIDINHLQDLK